VRRSIRRPIGSATLGLVALVAALAACATDELPLVCPDIAVGGLVITELRGNLGNEQGSSSTDSSSSSGSETTASGSESTGGDIIPADQGRDWIEVRNVGDGKLDLNGLVVRNSAQDGSDEVIMRVRYHRELDPGEPYVLGLVFDSERPMHIDYGVGDAKGTDNLLESGRVELSSCDTSIDLVVYDQLPANGTWSFGVEPPDAQANNDAAAWCVDANFAVIGGALEPGTPGEPNPPCD
jgi:hypothetical protein